MIKNIKISDIVVRDRKRSLDTQKVQELADSIKDNGLMNNITVSGQNELIAGYHRLEALKLLNNEFIDVNVMEVSEIDKELLEIDENLIRKELSVLERSEQLLRRKEIYEMKHPETKEGIAQANAMNKSKKDEHVNAESALTSKIENKAKSFVKDTSEKTGISERSLHEDIQIAKNLTDETKKAIKETPISDKKTKLLELARTDKNEQLEKALAMIKEEIFSNKEFKKIEKKIEKEPDQIYPDNVRVLIDKLKVEISGNNSHAIHTYHEIYYIIGKNKELNSILAQYKPHLLDIALRDFYFENLSDIYAFGFNPFFIPKLFKKQQKELVKQISNKIEELLIEYKDTGKEYYNKTVLMLREALESIRNKKFEEACNILYDFDIKIKF